MVNDKRVNLISFTGSSSVGQKVCIYFYFNLPFSVFNSH